MTLERDAKFEGKLALGFKKDMTSLVNFNARSEKFENLNLKKMERLIQKLPLEVLYKRRSL